MSDIGKAFPPVREPAQHDLYAVYNYSSDEIWLGDLPT